MPRSEVQKERRRAYERGLKRVLVTLYPADGDIAERLDKVKEKGLGHTEYIRELIREDMTRRPL